MQVKLNGAKLKPSPTMVRFSRIRYHVSYAAFKLLQGQHDAQTGATRSKGGKLDRLFGVI